MAPWFAGSVWLLCRGIRVSRDSRDTLGIGVFCGTNFALFTSYYRKPPGVGRSSGEIERRTETRMSKVGTSDSKNTLYCSFCGKSQHEVRKLIAGPTVFICDECVELCMDIIREENK